MSSRTAADKADAISLYHVRPSSSAKLVLKFPATSSAAPVGPLDDGRNNVLYCQGVVWDQVAPHNVPLLTT